MANESNPQEPTMQGLAEVGHNSRTPMPEVRGLNQHDELMKDGATNLRGSANLMEIEC